MRTNSRFRARATDSPIDVLPVPGGPTSVRIAPARRSGSIPRSRAQLCDGDVLDDPVLHVLEPRVVRVEHAARVLGVEQVLGAPAPRHGQQPVEVAADHRRLGRALAHALEAAELTLGLLAHVVGHAGLGDLRAVLLDDRGVVLAELLADRVHLPAQEELALLLLHARVHVVADALAQLHECQTLALQPSASSRRAVTSTSSRSETFCSNDRSGE